MANPALAIRRRFAGVADEVDYLYHKFLFWFYNRQDRARARPYALRLKKLLTRDKSHDQSILAEECWSLIREWEGDYTAAIRHRENEIRKIRRLHAITTKDQWEYVCRRYDYDDLSDRLDLLALLYDQIGQTDRAIRILRDSKALCARHGIPFDGADILQELLSDTSRNGQNTHATPRRNNARRRS